MADKGSRKGKFVMNRGYMCPGKVQQLYRLDQGLGFFDFCWS